MIVDLNNCPHIEWGYRYPSCASGYACPFYSKCVCNIKNLKDINIIKKEIGNKS